METAHELQQTVFSCMSSVDKTKAAMAILAYYGFSNKRISHVLEEYPIEYVLEKIELVEETHPPIQDAGSWIWFALRHDIVSGPNKQETTHTINTKLKQKLEQFLVAIHP